YNSDGVSHLDRWRNIFDDQKRCHREVQQMIDNSVFEYGYKRFITLVVTTATAFPTSTAGGIFSMTKSAVTGKCSR
ncbi:hypothetical protein, partial [Salmonella enterica]|uniref:hypothetical protein n=1 Tax=Salmonella enterica TaxID=28901 RepID=UPI002E9C2C5A|nr:hypothetical protein [Salmonella enterica subsp. enterica serovar Paratyphi A]